MKAHNDDGLTVISVLAKSQPIVRRSDFVNEMSRRPGEVADVLVGGF